MTETTRTRHKDITCQKCNSENVQFSEKRQAYVCIDCRHEFIITPSTPPRIFISYASSDGEEFARNLRSRLVEEPLGDFVPQEENHEKERDQVSQWQPGSTGEAICRHPGC